MSFQNVRSALDMARLGHLSKPRLEDEQRFGVEACLEERADSSPGHSQILWSGFSRMPVLVPLDAIASQGDGRIRIISLRMYEAGRREEIGHVQVREGG